MELTKNNIEKKFARYVLPSILTQMLTALYTIVDGLFIGRFAGDAGLAAVNLAWPVAAVIYAAATGIGTGGAVLIGIRMGAGQTEDVKKARGAVIALLFWTGIIFTVLLSLLLPTILTVLGAKDDVRTAAGDYLQIVIWGSTIAMFACGMGPMLRNFGHTVGVMAISMAGGLTNVILDGIFVGVLRQGAAGAAVATLIAQTLTLFCCAPLLLGDKNMPIRFSELRLRAQEVRSILSIGLSPFGLYIASSITLLFTNWQCLRYGGNDALAAYAVAAYVTGATGALLSGIGDGIQPLVSFAEGAMDHRAARRVFHKAVGLSLCFSGLICLVSILLRNRLGDLFGCGQGAKVLLDTAMIITPLAFPLMGLCKLCSAYLYAGGDHRYSGILIYLDPLCVAPVLLLLLPTFLKIRGIWVSYPATYVIMVGLAAILIQRHENKKKHSEF